MNRSNVITTALVLASAGVFALSINNVLTGSCPLSAALTSRAQAPLTAGGAGGDGQAPAPPAFTAATLDGRTVSLDDYKGRVVLVDFWATWCGPCIAELPNVKRTYEEHHDKGFDIVSISLDRNKDTLRRFVEREGLGWTHVYNADAAPGKDPASIYGVRAIPTMVLIGRDGKIAATNVRGKRLDTEVARALQAGGGGT